MIYQEICLERKGPYIKMGLRSVQWKDWLPVLRFWSTIVWRPAYGAGLMSAKTAWEVSELIHGIVRDVDEWKKSVTLWGGDFDGE